MGASDRAHSNKTHAKVSGNQIRCRRSPGTAASEFLGCRSYSHAPPHQVATLKPTAITARRGERRRRTHDRCALQKKAERHERAVLRFEALRLYCILILPIGLAKLDPSLLTCSEKTSTGALKADCRRTVTKERIPVVPAGIA